jgi:CRISPR-associated endonuclease Csn1
MPRNKRWRFGPDAMDRYKDERDFVARQLTDTAYATRLAREYLTEVCPPNKVWAVPGRLTALLRGKWGLNSILGDSNLKERVDHRHHAIDAAVATVTDRGLLQRLARANDRERDRIAVPEPWEGFRDAVRERVLDAVVSHKPDHGTGGKLHEETAYGFVADPAAEDGHNLVYSKSFADLNENESKRIRDAALRDAVERHLDDAKAAGIAHKKAMADFPLAPEDKRRWPKGIARVRLLKKEADVIGIRDSAGRAYKAYSPGDNHHVDIWELPDGKWAGTGVTVFEANQDPRAAEAKKPHPAARRVMRVHKGDLMILEIEGEEKIFRVVKLEPSEGNRRVVLAGHYDSGNLQKRNADTDDSFRWTFATFGKMKERKARLVRVDETGRVLDPGPPSHKSVR